MSKPRAVEITDAEILQLRKSLPGKINDYSFDDFAEAMRKTVNNLSLRPDFEVAAKVVYLDMVKRVPKAATAKMCIDRAIDGVWNEYVG